MNREECRPFHAIVQRLHAEVHERMHAVGLEGHLVLLVLAEEYVECAGIAPQCEAQKQQEPFDVLDHDSQGVNEWILCWLQHPAHTQHPHICLQKISSWSS